VLLITSVVPLLKFEIVWDKLSEVRVCTSENNVQEWITEFYNYLLPLLASFLKHLKNGCYKVCQNSCL
jgi:hypothetical protein